VQKRFDDLADMAESADMLRYESQLGTRMVRVSVFFDMGLKGDE
jgi:hypothetical protein